MTDVVVAAAVEQLHHGSHNHLLTDEPASSAAEQRLDAIIVPTAWPIDAIRHVLGVARSIDSPVVALCSRGATAEQALGLGTEIGTQVCAVNVDGSLARKLPAFATDRLLRRHGFAGSSDLSLKRNLGLLLARGAGWQRILFLDDDIRLPDPAGLALAARHLDTYRAVGLKNSGYPDNSVVCHAYRETGGSQDAFIGGGAMMVDPGRTSSFFPNIYNEDWFFLLGDGVPFRAARAGTMIQRPYDPFANPRRAVAEELGDTLAEGLFWVLEAGDDIDAAETGYWGDALFRRRMFIDAVLARTTDSRMRASLTAALGRSAEIMPWMCQEFVQLWREDVTTWRRFLEWVPVSSGVDKFLNEVGLAHLVHKSANFDA